MRLPRCLRRANRAHNSRLQPHVTPPPVSLDADSVEKALRAIPWKLRVPLVMVLHQRISRQEVAHRLRITPWELETRIKRAYRIFRIQMIGRGWTYSPHGVPPETIRPNPPDSTVLSHVPHA